MKIIGIVGAQEIEVTLKFWWKNHLKELLMPVQKQK